MTPTEAHREPTAVPPSPRRRVVRGAYTALGGQATRFVLQFGGLAVLARLLDPADFGTMAMLTAVVGIAGVLGDFGLSLVAVQARELTQAQRSQLFWWNAVLGAAVAALVAGVAGPVAQFYGVPPLRDAARVLAVTFLLNGLAVQFRAELNRALRFGALAAVDVGGQLAGTVAALAAALSGAGFWALVLQPVVTAVAGAVLTVTMSGWRPGPPRRGTPMRGFAGFGLATTLTQVMNFVSSNVDSVLIGRLHGQEALGYYSRAFQLVMTPIQQILSPMTRVALPALSRVDDVGELNRYVHRTQRAILYVLLPGLALVAALRHEVVWLLLGPGWERSAEIFLVLVVGGAFQSMGSIYYWVFLARRSMRALLVCEGAGRVVMIALVAGAAPRGPLAVAVAVSLGLALVWLLTTTFGLPTVHVRRWPVVGVAARPALVAAAVFASVSAARASVVASDDVAVTALGLAAVPIAAALLWSAGGVRADVREVVRTLSPR